MLKFGEAVPAITGEELLFAVNSASLAYEGKLHDKPVHEKTGPIQIGDKTYRLTDVPLNRAGLAHLDALGHDKDKAHAALYRSMIIGMEVWNAPGAKKWILGDAPECEVNMALMDAIGAIPTKWGDPVSVDAVLKLADEIAAKEEAAEKSGQ